MTGIYGLDDFVGDARNVISRRLSSADTLQALTPAFKRLLVNRSLLHAKMQEVDTDTDEVCLHHDADQGFVVLARGVGTRDARQGQSHAAMPHDHGPLWALYGIYEGAGRLQRYVPDASCDSEPFPGLRLTSDAVARAGDIDAIEPHNMHLPVFSEDRPTVVLVVYSGQLESVVRRGYVAQLKRAVDFQGTFPSSSGLAQSTRAPGPQVALVRN